MTSFSPRLGLEPSPAFRLIGGSGDVAPIVLASPHSGRDYPAVFLTQTRLAIGQLRRAEDAYVDALLEGGTAHGVPLIAANYGRAYIDLNRDPRELDPEMFAEPLAPDSQVSDRVAAGLGVLPRIAAQGLDIYPAKLRLAEAHARVAQVHDPYHNAIVALLDRAQAKHGYAILLDCHSMPTPPAGAYGTPQIVLGDLHGQSAAPALVDAIEAQLRRNQFRVARNVPYAGGYTTVRHAAPAQGRHVVQIEIDRALYMDPGRLTRHGGFATVGAMLTRLIEMLLTASPSLGLAPPTMLAAE